MKWAGMRNAALKEDLNPYLYINRHFTCQLKLDSVEDEAFYSYRFLCLGAVAFSSGILHLDLLQEVSFLPP